MRRTRFFRTILTILTSTQISFPAPQSLADAARKEAERRKALEEQGIEGKVVVVDPGRMAAKESRPEGWPAPAAREPPGRTRASRSQISLRALRTTLQKLDREILHGEERLVLLRARMESEKWQLPKVGKISRSNNASVRERLRFQIQELEAKLKLWRRERYETYDAGRKAGFLPGELDGKGIMP